MNDGEQSRPAYGPVGLAGPIGLTASSSFSWARLGSGVFAVAISLAMGWQAGRPADVAGMGEPQPKEPPAAPAALLAQAAPATPLQELQAIAGPRETDPAAAAAPRDALLQAVAPAEVMGTRAVRPAPRRQQLRGANGRSGVRAAFAQRRAPANHWTSDYPVVRTRFIRTRSAVRSEFIATRRQVAAMTGEDSGSAYLTQVAAARQDAEAARPHRRALQRERARKFHNHMATSDAAVPLPVRFASARAKPPAGVGANAG